MKTTLDDDLIISPNDAAVLLQLLDPASMFRHSEAAKALIGAITALAEMVPSPLNGDTLFSGHVVWHRVKINSVHNQVYTVVRAKSKAAALRMLNAAEQADGVFRTSARHFASHWSTTSNRKAACAAKEPGVYALGAKGWVQLKSQL